MLGRSASKMHRKKLLTVPLLFVGALILLLSTSCSDRGVEKSYEAENGLMFEIKWYLDNENFEVYSLHVINGVNREIHTEDYSDLGMGYNSGFVFEETSDAVKIFTGTKPPELLTTYNLK